MSRSVASLLAGLSLTAVCGGLQASHVPDQDLVFRVLLDGDPIGYHRFDVTRQGEKLIVAIDARFKVTFLGIPVYRYQHRNQEIWQQDCLASIVSSTVDGGDDYHVDGQELGKQFELSTQDGDRTLDAGCVMTFAYWDREFLQQSRLLNAQNGEYLPVKISAQGAEDLQVKGRTVKASRHRIVNSDKGIDITVWHAVDDGRWLALESKVDGGRVIRYQLADSEQLKALQPLMESSAAAAARLAQSDSRQ